MDARFELIERRLAVAERQVRLQRFLLLILLVGFIAAATAKPGNTLASGQTVQAPFKVVDDDGHTIFWVYRGMSGGVACVKSAVGESEVTLSTGQGLCGITASADGGFMQAHFGASSDSGGFLNLFFPGFRPSVSMFSGKHGGEVYVYNRAKEKVAELTAAGSGGQLRLRDPDGGLLFSKP